MERVPVGMLEQIIEYRVFAATFAAYQHHKDPKATSEMWDLIKAIDDADEEADYYRRVEAAGHTA